MRVAGHTYAYRDLSLDEALDQLVSLGLSAVEIWLGHAAEEPDTAASAVRERGLEVPAVSAGGFYAADSDPVRRAVELAQALGASVVVACVEPDVLDALVDHIPAGIRLCVENHWDQRLARAREVRGALAAYPGLAACVDTGHAIVAGEAPDRFVGELAERVGHVHLKEAAFPRLRERLMGRRLRTRLLSRPEPVAPGAGALDVARFERALRDVHFAGTVTLEYEGAEPSVALRLLLEAWRSAEERAGRAPSG
jgi:inosose dehydratase